METVENLHCTHIDSFKGIYMYLDLNSTHNAVVCTGDPFVSLVMTCPRSLLSLSMSSILCCPVLTLTSSFVTLSFQEMPKMLLCHLWINYSLTASSVTRYAEDLRDPYWLHCKSVNINGKLYVALMNIGGAMGITTDPTDSSIRVAYAPVGTQNCGVTF